MLLFWKDLFWRGMDFKKPLQGRVGAKNKVLFSISASQEPFLTKFDHIWTRSSNFTS